MSSLHQSIHLSVAHRYWNVHWSREKNRAVFGADGSSEGLGSNMRLEAEVVGGEASALQAAMAHLKSLADHECLFTAVERFQTLPSSVENIALYLGQELWRQPCGGGGAWAWLQVWETAHTGATIFPDGTVDLHFRFSNLELVCRGPIDPESGLIASRLELERAARTVVENFSKRHYGVQEVWARELFAELAGMVKSLRRLRIDLGRQEYLVVP